MASTVAPAAVFAPATSSATRWFVLVGAIIVQLILGTVYGYSIFWEPLQARIYPPVITQAEYDARIAAGEDVGQVQVVATADERAALRATQQGYIKYAFSIAILSFAIVMVIAGRVQDVKGPRFTAIIGAVLMGLGFLLAGLMNQPVVFYLGHAGFAGVVGLVLLMLFEGLSGGADRARSPILKHVPLAVAAAVVVAAVLIGQQFVGQSGEFDQLFLLWGTVGFLAGAGIGFAYVCPIAALIKWFPKHKGLVSGLAVAGFGFGAYLFKGRTFGALGYIESRGVVEFFLVHALVCFVAVTIGALLLRNPPAAAAGPAARASSDSTWQDTLRRPAFYVLWLMFFSGAMAGLMVIGIVAPFVTERLQSGAIGTDEAIAAGATAVGALAIFNALGRIAWGLLSDRIGRTGTFVLMFGLQAVVMFVLGTLSGKMALYAVACLVGFNFGGNFALFPSATADLFGARNLGANYGWVFTSYGIAGVVGITAGNIAKTQTGSYSAAFVLAGCLCVLSAILAIGLRMSQQRRPAAA